MPPTESPWQILTAPELFAVHASFFFVLGLLFGSFFNVCIYRIPSGQAISLPASYCYACGAHIRWYDNVPVLSYLALRGRCRSCRAPFSSRYALIELLTGCLFLGVFVQFGFSWAMLTYLVFTGLLLISTFTDVDNWVILDRISLGGAAAGVVFALVLAFIPPFDPEDWILAHSGPAPGRAWWGPAANSLVGAASGAGLLWGIGFLGSVAFRKPAMGLGDVKLLALIGAFGGWAVALLSIFLGAIFGSIWGIGAIVWQRAATVSKADAPTQASVDECQAAIDAALADDGGATAKRGWAFDDHEKAVLAKLALRGAQAPPAPTHHLPFGPHLALAAWVLLVLEPQVMGRLRDFFAPVVEYYSQ